MHMWILQCRQGQIYLTFNVGAVLEGVRCSVTVAFQSANSAAVFACCVGRIHKWVEGADISKATDTAYPHTSHCLVS
jgi:hypothetical protein